MLSVLGRRAAPAACTRAPGTAAPSRRGQFVAQPGQPAALGLEVARRPARRPRPARRSPATFSVPGRRPRSWPAPNSRLGSVQPRPHAEQAHALGRVQLVAGHRQQVHAQVVHAHRDLADRLRGVGVHQRAARARGRRDGGHRLRSRRSRCSRASPRPAPSPGRSRARRPPGRRGRRRRPADGVGPAGPAPPGARQTSLTAGCSTAEMTRSRRPRARRAGAAPIRAWLLASVPPLVKTISSGRHAEQRRGLAAGPLDRVARARARGRAGSRGCRSPRAARAAWPPARAGRRGSWRCGPGRAGAAAAFRPPGGCRAGAADGSGPRPAEQDGSRVRRHAHGVADGARRPVRRCPPATGAPCPAPGARAGRRGVGGSAKGEGLGPPLVITCTSSPDGGVVQREGQRARARAPVGAAAVDAVPGDVADLRWGWSRPSSGPPEQPQAAAEGDRAAA